MTDYLGAEILLLLLPTKLVIGRPHLSGSPRRPCHSVDLSEPLLVLGLWLSLVGRDQKDQVLYGRHQVLHRLSPFGDLPAAQLNLHSPNHALLRWEHLRHATQAIRRRDLGFIPYQANVIDLQVLVPLSVLKPGVWEQRREALLHPELPPGLGQVLQVLP